MAIINKYPKTKAKAVEFDDGKNLDSLYKDTSQEWTIDDFATGGYINTSGTSVTTDSSAHFGYKVTSDVNFAHIVIDVDDLQTGWLISAHGGQTPRMWAWVDENDNIILACSEQNGTLIGIASTVPDIIYPPVGAKKLIVNNRLTENSTTSIWPNPKITCFKVGIENTNIESKTYFATCSGYKLVNSVKTSIIPVPKDFKLVPGVTINVLFKCDSFKQAVLVGSDYVDDTTPYKITYASGYTVGDSYSGTGNILSLTYNGTSLHVTGGKDSTYANATFGNSNAWVETILTNTKGNQVAFASTATAVGGDDNNNWNINKNNARLVVKFKVDVPADCYMYGGASYTDSYLNIYSVPIYYRDAPIEDGVIKAGDTCLLTYRSKQWHLLSNDRWESFETDNSYTDNKIAELANIYDAKGSAANALTSAKEYTDDAITKAVSGKADKATTLAGYGINDVKIENGVITIGNNTITPLTSHQNIYSLLIKDANGTEQLNYNPSSKESSISLTKSTVGLDKVENTALSTWAGTTNITKLGTITTGVWNGSKISGNYLETEYLPLAGGILTGQLQLSGTAYPQIYGNEDGYLYLSAKSDGIYGIAFDYNTQSVRPRGNNNTLLGTSSYRWNNIYSHYGNFSGQITSSVATGTAPFVVASTTEVANLHSATSSKLHTARTIALTGAATGTATSFDGSTNISIPVTSLNAYNVTGALGYNSVYFLHHPEDSSATIIPYLYNDISFLLNRGGECTVYSTTDTDFTQLTLSQTILTEASGKGKSNMFDSAPDYMYIQGVEKTDTVIIDIALSEALDWGNKYYIDFGYRGWRAKDVSLYVWHTDNPNQLYTLAGNQTNSTLPYFSKNYTYNWENASGTVKHIVNRIRFVCTNWYSDIKRIAQIGVVNNASKGHRIPYMSRGIDDPLWRSITPATTNKYDLGSSTARWQNVYSNSLNVSGNTTVAGRLVLSSSTYPQIYGNGDYLSIGASASDSYGISLDSGAKALRPRTNNVTNLGTSSMRWSNLYSNTGNFSGDVTASNFIGALKGNADTATLVKPFNVTSNSKYSGLIRLYECDANYHYSNSDGSIGSYAGFNIVFEFTNYLNLKAGTIYAAVRNNGSLTSHGGQSIKWMFNDGDSTTICKFYLTVKRTETSTAGIYDVKYRFYIWIEGYNSLQIFPKIEQTANGGVLTRKNEIIILGDDTLNDSTIADNYFAANNETVISSLKDSIFRRNSSVDVRSTASLYPEVTTSVSLGSSSLRWLDIYAKNANLSGTLAVSGTSTLTGNTFIGGTLGVTGATTLNSKLTVGGNINPSGKCSLGQYEVGYWQAIYLQNGGEIGNMSIQEHDCWTYNYTKDDGTAVALKIGHYGYMPQSPDGSKTNGGFLSNYHGFNFHSARSGSKFRFGYDSGENLTWGATITAGGNITCNDVIPNSHYGATLGNGGTYWNALYVKDIYTHGTITTHDSFKCPNIELSMNTPFIDFHYGGNDTVDYTNRIIEGLSGQLTITGKLRIGLRYTDSTDYNFHVVGSAYASTSITTPTATITNANITTLRRIQEATTAVPTIWVSSSNYDNTILRVDYSKKDTYIGDYGFSLKYMGSGGSAQNNLNLYADNQTSATQVVAWSVNQNGQVAIRTAATNTNYDLYVNSTAYIPTLTTTTINATSIKIGDATISWDSTNGALKIDKSVYSSGGMSALGWSDITSDGSSSGGSTIDLSSISTNIIPSASATYNLGSSDKRWLNLYASNANLTGTLNVVGASTFNNIATFIGGAEFQGSVTISDDLTADVIKATSLTINGNAVATQSWVNSKKYTAFGTSVPTSGAYFLDAALGYNMNTAIIELQQATFTGTFAIDYAALTYFTQSGGNRTVTIPTYDAEGLENYNQTSCLVNRHLIDDIMSYADSVVSVTRSLTEGTKIATISVGSNIYELFAPTSGQTVSTPAFDTLAIDGGVVHSASSSSRTLSLVSGSNVSLSWDSDNVELTIGVSGSFATQDWVTSQGYTKNTGTITGIKMNGASKGTSGVVDLGTVLTSHQTIYNLTLQAGTFSAKTFDPNAAAQTVNIPTKTSHLTNDSGFITSLPTQWTDLIPMADNTHNLGSANFAWNQLHAKEIYVGAGSVYLGDGIEYYLSSNGGANLNAVSVSSLKVGGNSIAAAAYKGVTTSVTSGDTNLVTSGAVYTAIDGISKINLTSISSNIVPKTSEDYNLGSNDYPWLGVYCGNITLNDLAYSYTHRIYGDSKGGLVIEGSNMIVLDGDLYTKDSLFGNYGDEEKWYIDYLGNALFVSVDQSSDATKKDIIGYTELTLSQIANAPSVYFTWKNDKEKKRNVGTIAQYWKEVLPEVVNGEDGNMAMQYGNAAMSSVITVAKETLSLKERIKTLEEENKKLKEEIESIKQML